MRVQFSSEREGQTERGREALLLLSFVRSLAQRPSLSPSHSTLHHNTHTNTTSPPASHDTTTTTHNNVTISPATIFHTHIVHTHVIHHLPTTCTVGLVALFSLRVRESFTTSTALSCARLLPRDSPSFFSSLVRCASRVSMTVVLASTACHRRPLLPFH